MYFSFLPPFDCAPSDLCVPSGTKQDPASNSTSTHQLSHSCCQHAGLTRTCPKIRLQILAHGIETVKFKGVPRNSSHFQEPLCGASGTLRPARSVAVMEQPMSLSISPSVSWAELKSRVMSLFLHTRHFFCLQLGSGQRHISESLLFTVNSPVSDTIPADEVFTSHSWCPHTRVVGYLIHLFSCSLHK